MNVAIHNFEESVGKSGACVIVLEEKSWEEIAKEDIRGTGA